MEKVKKELLSGIAYSAISKYSGVIVSIVVSMILSRILLPKQFGTVAIATIFISFFSTLTTTGISPAIVQNKTLDKNELKSINAFTFLVATLFTVFYLFCIPLILDFYEGYELLSNVLYLLSVNIFFSIAAIVPNSLLLKNKQFKFIGIRTLLIQLIIGVISVVGAFSGMGIYALLVNPILGSFSLFLVCFYVNPIGFNTITGHSLKKILSFSIFQILFNITYLLYRNIDKIFIGRLFGVNIVGYYEKSYRLMMLPLENISGVVSPVLHPILSEYQYDKEYLWQAYLKLLSILSEIGFLLTTVVFFSSDSLITIMYGEQWEPAIPFFKILSLSIGFQIIQSPIGAIFQSINKVKGLFYSSMWILFFIFISVFVSYLYGTINLLIYGIVISFIIGFLVYQIYLTNYLKTSLYEILLKILRPFLINFLLFIILSAFTYLAHIPKQKISFLFLILLISLLYTMLMIACNYLPYSKMVLLTIKNKYLK